MSVDVRRVEFANGGLDDPDRLGPVGDECVAQAAHLQLRADQLCGALGLDRPDVHISALGATRQGQDMNGIAVGAVLGERAAAADLDVVGMGADRQHRFCWRLRRTFTALARSMASSTNSAEITGLNISPSIRHLTAWRRNCGSWLWVAISVAVQR